MLEMLVEHLRDHAQNIWEVAVCDLVFEIADDDGSRNCRSRHILLRANQAEQAGVLFVLDHAPREGRGDELRQRCARPLRIRESVLMPGKIDLVAFDSLGPPARDRGPKIFCLLTSLQGWSNSKRPRDFA